MKTSDGFVKTTIAGIPYLLPYGQKIDDHARSVRLNDSSALLWDTLSLGADKSTLYLCWRITTIQMLICSLSLPLT